NPRSPYGERPTVRVSTPPSSHFNPRSPYGERLKFTVTVSTDHTFQSTLPLRGATITGRKIRHPYIISIHAPLTGSDKIAWAMMPQSGYFNPRSPYGERQLRFF